MDVIITYDIIYQMNSFKNKQAFCFIIKSLWIKDHWSDIIWLTMRISYLWLSRNSGLYITKRTVEIDLLVQKLEVFYISDQNWLTGWVTYYTFLDIWVNKGNFNLKITTFLCQSLVKTLILVLSDQNWLTEIVKGAKNWLMLPQCKKTVKKVGAFMFFACVMLSTVCGYLSQTVS